MMALKLRLHQSCLDSIQTRIEAIRQSMQDAHAAGLEETKSSAGDKYETGRAMMHLEMEKLATQLAEAEKQKLTLLQINPALSFEKIQTGSLILTRSGNYYLSVSAGIFEVDGRKYITLSAASPLGTKLIGLSAGATFTWNNQSVTIEKVA